MDLESIIWFDNKSDYIKEVREAVEGYTYHQLQNPLSYQETITNYVQYIHRISPKLNHFIEEIKEFDEGFWEQVLESWQENPHGLGLKTTKYTQKNKTSFFGHFSGQSSSKLSFTLHIQNQTKYFLNACELISGSLIQQPVHFLWKPPTFKGDRPRLTKLENFKTFVIPPFTAEKLIFMQKEEYFAVDNIKSILTFLVGDSSQTESVKKLMVMFKIEDKHKTPNVFAVGLTDPENLIKPSEVDHIFYDNTKNDNEATYFAKGNTTVPSRISLQQSHVKNCASQITWPPENKRALGSIAASFSMGNGKHSVGQLTLTCLQGIKFKDDNQE